ncbi:nicotinate-nicotinamide nucleotide adenylyltransferase [Enterovibrio norvegicus FF-33]|uniref:nicotinate-nicotinamide nucleotide adenylyltransferase n=1 Tax=Enterovibrio TaxID=188143 RepID=UPI0002FE0DDD|nr:nicotinate-nicotinamide nucleotide adenylyltransferase [Enterovibrio norvegicus]OEE66964.1 nicotinate-nicotinamide nucleotide adenylyltransferase [Enterovibrio norvegicus FF-33]OEE75295.1 nicotinate-nicotinamide nucleotide adenylyltransferase [Enterovibrio norvegicus FF-162]
MVNTDLHQKIAIFGSAFNPPSLGHLSVVQRLAHYDKVLLVPSYSHAWGKKMADFTKRCQWVKGFIEDAGCSNLDIYLDEKSLGEEGAVTTWALLNHIQKQYPNSDLTFVLGPDNFLSFAKFYRSQDILKRWSVLACPESVPVRSTEIRKRLEQDIDISDLTTPTVAANMTKIDFSAME